MAKKVKGEAFEGTAKDMREDKKLAKITGMSEDAWEKSKMDERHDKMGGMAKGGSVVRGGGAAVRGMKYHIS